MSACRARPAASGATPPISSSSTRRLDSGETFTAARPLTAATKGRLLIQSTPGSPVGPFYELATHPPEGWAFLRVRSDEVGTIAPEFLERERRATSPDLYAQEYQCEFGRGGETLFTLERVNALFAGPS